MLQAYYYVVFLYILLHLHFFFPFPPGHSSFLCLRASALWQPLEQYFIPPQTGQV